MSLLAIITSVLPILLKILDTFIKTPADKWADLSNHLLELTNSVKDAIEVGKKTGDYSELEKILNNSAH